MSATAPCSYKKDGTARTRRAPGTGARYKGPAKATSLPIPPCITCHCSIIGCNLNFTNTKNPKNSLLVHVRYKAGKGDIEHQLELEKMKTARKTERMYYLFLLTNENILTGNIGSQDPKG